MKNFKVVEKNDELWIVEKFPGKSLNAILEEILTMRDEMNIEQKIELKFNEVKLLINKNSTLETLYDEYHSVLLKERNEYLNSKKYQDFLDKEKSLSDKYKIKGQKLLNKFDDALKNTSSLVKWLGEFSVVTDYTTLDYKPKELAQKMKEKGFDYEPQEGLRYDTKEILGRDIIANAFHSLSSGNKIHCAAKRLADNYKDLEDKEKILSKIGKVREGFNNTSSINKATKPL